MSEDTITVTIPDDKFIDYKINVSNYTSSIYNNNISPSWGTLNSTIGANGSSSSYYSNVNYSFSNSTTSKTRQFDGDAEFDGDVKIKGVSIVDAIDKINKRLAILVPDPAKLEYFEALKRAYENYKILENLCQLPVSDPDK
jgi:hypothetical protein